MKVKKKKKKEGRKERRGDRRMFWHSRLQMAKFLK